MRFRVSRRTRVNSQVVDISVKEHSFHGSEATGDSNGREWFAIFTVPKNEKSVLKHLALRSVESFLPTYEDIHSWKNRQRVQIALPLFPSYLFVHISMSERIKVLQSPGVLHIVGNGRNHVPLDRAEMEFLRWGLCGRKIEPYRELVVGRKVRIKTGVMEGILGTLVRKNSSLRFVLTLNLINQHASVEVDADLLEPVI
jgi:transcriptional antiterminator RfaH